MQKMNRRLGRVALAGAAAGVLGSVLSSQASAVDRTWANVGTAWGDTANWTGGVVPTSSDRAVFDLAVTAQPNLTASATVYQVYFKSTTGGYTLSGDAGTTLTLKSSDVNNPALLQASNSSVNTISANLVLGAAAGTIQHFGVGAANTAYTKVDITGQISSTNQVSLRVYGSQSTSALVWSLTNTGNSFTGDLLHEGNNPVWLYSIADKGQISSAGAGNKIVMGTTQSNYQGTVVYKGSLNSSSNRDLEFRGSGTNPYTLTQDGAGSLTFKGGTFSYGSTARSKTLNLNGTGVGEFGFDVPYNGDYTTTINKSGTGTWLLSGNNSFGGSSATSGGILKLGHANALGRAIGALQTATAAPTSSVAASSTLDLNGQSGITEIITINGTGMTGAGGALINSSATLASIGAGITGFAFGIGSGYSTAPTVTITGGGGTGATATASLGVSTSSFLITSGTTTYSAAPTVTIAGNSGVVATATAVLTGGLVTGITLTSSGSGFTTAPTIAFSGGTKLVAGTDPTGTGNSTNFTVGGLRLTSAGSGYITTPSITIDGNATANAAMSGLVLAGNATIGGIGDITINAPVSESTAGRTLTKAGVNTLTLAATNSFTGLSTITEGKMLVNGSIPGAATVATTGTLGGTGAIGGVVTVNGTLAPGASIESLGTGNLSITATGTLDNELGRSGATPISDLVNVTGTVTLAAGANLNLTKYAGLTDPEANDVFFLVANNLVDTVTGTFTKLNGVATTLTEGSEFAWNSQNWKITYQANYEGSSFTGGNDVAIQALTSVPEPASLGLVGLAAAGFLSRRRRR